MVAVVLVLAVLGILAVTGYQLASTHAITARSTEAALRAEENARVGIVRYIQDEDRTVGETVTYSSSIQGGEATVEARKLHTYETYEDHYLLTSTATYRDARMDASAERTIREYFALVPLLYRRATFAFAGDDVYVKNGSRVVGDDAAASGDCAEPTGAIGGVAAFDQIDGSDGTISGSPATMSTLDYATMVDSLRLDWEWVRGAEFAVDYEDTWPDFSSLASDAYPSVRINGDLTATSSENGRGLLIVTGTLQAGGNFTWDGVILAGRFFFDGSDPPFTLRGMLFANLERGKTSADDITTPSDVDLQYHRCHVAAALRDNGELMPHINTRWESY